MSTKIFVNMAVKNLEKSMDFFKKLGYTFNKQFTDKNAACLVISDDIFAMLLVPDFFKKFTKKTIADAHTTTESATCLSVESKQKVDQWANKALAMGATENIVEEMDVEDFMYGRSINDLDGHIWEIIWMDESKVQKP